MLIGYLKASSACALLNRVAQKQKREKNFTLERRFSLLLLGCLGCTTPIRFDSFVFAFTCGFCASMCAKFEPHNRTQNLLLLT